MSSDEEKTLSRRDRTYRETDDGDYLDQAQYLFVAVSLCITHCLFEVFYLWLGCTPMAIINIGSILAYVASIIIVKKGNTLITVWIMIQEVFLHVIFATVFLGLHCGYQLWLFGTFASIFLPFFTPDLSKTQKSQIGIFSIVIVATFLALTVAGNKGILPTKYNVGEGLGRIMYSVNAVLGFGAIMIYTTAYNLRMAGKNKELQRAADHDYLTGIFNRLRIQTILESEVARAKELNETRLAVAIVDVDFFKNINDTYGHIAGDNILKGLTDIFREKGNEGLLYGRWGGEEFLLISPEDITYEEFGKLLEAIRNQVEENAFVSGDQKLHVTISVGAAQYENGMTAEKLVHIADERLYDAKETGRNKVIYKK